MILPDKFCNLLEILFHVVTPDNNKMMFSSFHGQYNDNPKYISMVLHDRYPDITIYWVLSKKSCMNDIPPYVKVLHYNTFRYCWIKNRCKVIVENGAGYYLFDNSTKWFGFKKHLKNKKQFDFSTWHGNPIKHIGAQIPGNEFWSEDTFYTTSDLLIAGCQLVKNIFREAFLNKMPVELLGTPRTDILFLIDHEHKVSIKKKLGLPIDKRIVLYAPTYRNNTEDSGIKQMRMIDFERLFSSLNTKFEGEWIFIFRVHNMVLLEIDVESLIKKYHGKVINGNGFDDMAEYLYVSDVLISDYSGCVFDIALTEKPCFLYAHDRDEYEKRERGLYFPISKFPYPFAESFDDLLNNIRTYDKQNSTLLRREFLNYIGNMEDGNASNRVVDFITKKILKK